MGLVYPTNTTNVSDTFGDHENRGSPNPGTDYTCGYGSPIFAVAAGVIQVADSGNGGGGGRTINLAHDDGWGSDYLHLSGIVIPGGRVSQGQLIAYSGGSGYGDDWYYGPHLHISYRPNHSTAFSDVDNRDFHSIITSGGGGGSAATPTDSEDIMIRIQSPARGLGLIGPGYYRHLDTNEEVEQSGPLISAHYNGNDRQYDLWVSMSVDGRAAG
jgi:murein DD-endopeptidase MepM/ murein hydrolase activator NlpD